MNLLDHPLIKKYFRCQGPCDNPYHQNHLVMNILTAMQEPIKSGEMFLDIQMDYQPSRDWQIANIREMQSMSNYGTWHPSVLRLPSRFQPKQECGCNSCASAESFGMPPCKCCCQGKPSPSKVEARIEHLAEAWKHDGMCASKPYYIEQLKELVRLAKEEK